MQIPVLPSGYLTQAGQTKPEAFTPETIEAIQGVYEVLASSYGNQFYKAFPTTEQTNIAKRLWAKHLNNYPKNQLIAVASEIIANETFLPSLATFKSYCDKAHELYGLPDAHRAYVEACRAPKPKANYHWSHPAVYYAGVATDWFFLETEPESVVFPVFKRNYKLICERVMKGETIESPIPKALPQEINTPMSVEENKKQLAKLRKIVEL